MSQKNEPTLREQMVELEKLLEWFEQDDLDIEEALKKFQQADELAEKVEKRLNHLENEIVILKKRFEQ